ncbi:MAG: hypothetical protein ACTS73_05805 [Arsenophonus sp. NEOnobi-MAG3]
MILELGGTGHISKLLTGEYDVLVYLAATQLKLIREDARFADIDECWHEYRLSNF